MPGCAPGCSVANFTMLPATTRGVVLVGNQDTFYEENTAKQIWGVTGRDSGSQQSLHSSDRRHPRAAAARGRPLRGRDDKGVLRGADRGARRL